MLQAGIKGKKEITVTLDKTAKAMGSGTMDVFFISGLEYITLPTKISKQDNKKMMKYVREQSKLFYKQYKAETESRLLSMKGYDKFVLWFNTNMLNKLKAKAEQQK